MAPSKSRRKQLQKLAERRAAERRRARRRRALTIATAFAVAAAGGTALFFAFTGNEPGKPLAGPSPSVSQTAPANPPYQPPPNKVACGGKRPATAGEEKQLYPQPPPLEIDPETKHTAVVKTSCGTIEIDLFAKQSPLTVNSFVFLAEQGFYDGTYFHRVIKDFMNQGGDPSGTGSGGPGYQFEDETSNGLVFDEVGLLAMANSGPGTNGSQFFITTSKPDHLNGAHTIFGKVTKGYDVVTRINMLETGEEDRPTTAVYIESIRIVVE